MSRTWSVIRPIDDTIGFQDSFEDREVVGLGPVGARGGLDERGGAAVGGGGGGMDALEGGGRYHPPLQGAQPMPSHCLPNAKCQLQWLL